MDKKEKAKYRAEINKHNLKAEANREVLEEMGMLNNLIELIQLIQTINSDYAEAIGWGYDYTPQINELMKQGELSRLLGEEIKIKPIPEHLQE